MARHRPAARPNAKSSQDEATATGIKTVKGVKKSKVPIPIVSIAGDLRGRPLSAEWLRARKEQGLDMAVQKCSMPAPDFALGSWTVRPLKTEEVGTWLRALLKSIGLLEGNVGAHSLKSTCLVAS